jgi:ATP-dependent DNA helicase RecQ
MVSSGLDQLSTFGLLKDCGGDYVRDLFEAMEQAGLIATEQPGEYPLLVLTADGDAVMRGQIEPLLAWPQEGGKRAKPAGKGKTGGRGARPAAKKWPGAKGRKGKKPSYP